MDLFEEVNAYVLYLKRKMLIYVAIIFIRLSSSEKKPMTDYIIECQMSFLQNHKNVSFVLKQKLLTFLQQSLFFKLQFNSNANKMLLNYSEEIKHQANDLFNFNVLTRPFEKEGPKQIELEVKNKGYKQIEHKIKNSTVVNIRFIQALLTLKSLLDTKPETNLFKLDSFKKCIKTLNYSSEKHLYENLVKCKNKGLGISLDCSENEWHDVISSSVIQFILQTSDTDCLLLESARNVITFIKYEVQQDALNHFYSWSGSLIENAFSTLMALSESHKHYFDIICKFICSTVHEIWENEKLSDHEQMECQIHILSEFIKNEEMCIELLKFILGKLNCGKIKTKTKIHWAEKLNFLLMFCSKVLDIYVVLRLKTKPKCKDIKNHDLVTLWKQEYTNSECCNDYETTNETLITNMVNMLESLLISYSNELPILSIPISKCLNYIRIINF